MMNLLLLIFTVTTAVEAQFGNNAYFDELMKDLPIVKKSSDASAYYKYLPPPPPKNYLPVTPKPTGYFYPTPSIPLPTPCISVPIKTTPAPPKDCMLTVEEEWELWKVKFNKTYPTRQEEVKRKALFIRNAMYINAHNDRYARGEVSFEMEKNEFTDQTYEELVETRTGFNPEIRDDEVCPGRVEVDVEYQLEEFEPSKRRRKSELCEEKVIKDDGSIYHLDWRTRGAVTPVKKQGKCASCWAFASAGVVESYNFLKSGRELTSLSEQNLIDCVQQETKLCRGSSLVNAFRWMEGSRGINPEEEYPYEKSYREDEPPFVKFSCRFDPENVMGAFNETVELLKGNEERLKRYNENRKRRQAYYDIEPGNEEELQKALETHGPIAVGVYFSEMASFVYNQGVFYDPGCTQKLRPNHALLLIGYGETQKGEKFWLLKNSYGEAWGENGYMRIAKNRNNHCEIATYATFVH